MAEARGGGINETRIARVQRVPAVAELLHRAWAKVLDERIRLVEQPLEGLAAVGRFEVEGDRLLAPVDRNEIGRFAVLERAVLPRVVALPRRLDLDHARSELGEQQGAVRTRKDAGQIDDRDTRERPVLRHGRRFPLRYRDRSIA